MTHLGLESVFAELTHLSAQMPKVGQGEYLLNTHLRSGGFGLPLTVSPMGKSL